MRMYRAMEVVSSFSGYLLGALFVVMVACSIQSISIENLWSSMYVV